MLQFDVVQPVGLYYNQSASDSLLSFFCVLGIGVITAILSHNQMRKTRIHIEEHTEQK